MTFDINSTYKIITQQFDQTDVYFINPFDQNDFLINQINIDIRLDVWNGYPIIIYIPEIRSLNKDYNFVVNITSTYNTEGGIEPTGNAVVSAGNDYDTWNDGVTYNYQSMTWTPIGMYDSTAGIYSITPYNPQFLQAQLASRALDSVNTESTVAPNIEAFKNWVALSKQK